VGDHGPCRPPWCLRLASTRRPVVGPHILPCWYSYAWWPLRQLDEAADRDCSPRSTRLIFVAVTRPSRTTNRFGLTQRATQYGSSIVLGESNWSAESGNSGAFGWPHHRPNEAILATAAQVLIALSVLNLAWGVR